MKNEPIIIVAGEPYSIFLEIFFKSVKRNIFKKPIIELHINCLQGK